MTAPEDPYAAPPREREAGSGGSGWGPPPGSERPYGDRPFGEPGDGAPPPLTAWGQPTGPPVSAPPPGPGPGSGGLGTASLVLGVLALITGVTIVGGVLLGPPAVVLGVRGVRRARQRRGGAGRAVAGIVLGVLGLLAAGAAYLYVRGPLEEFRGCQRESVSLAQDRACEEQFRRDLEQR